MDSRFVTTTSGHTMRGASAKATIRDAMAVTSAGVPAATTACPASISPTDPSVALMLEPGRGKRARLADDLGVVLVEPSEEVWGALATSSTSSGTPASVPSAVVEPPPAVVDETSKRSPDSDAPNIMTGEKYLSKPFLPSSLNAGVALTVAGTREEEEDKDDLPARGEEENAGTVASGVDLLGNDAQEEDEKEQNSPPLANVRKVKTTRLGAPLASKYASVESQESPSAMGVSTEQPIPAGTAASRLLSTTSSASSSSTSGAGEEEEEEDGEGEDAFQGSQDEVVTRLVSESGDGVLSPGPPGTVAIFQTERFAASYVKTRHANLRCFPHCAVVHKSRSFCGATVTALVRLGDEIATEQDVYVVGEFRNAQRPPALRVGDVVEDIRSLLLPVASAPERTPLITGYAIESDAARRQAVFQLQPRRKWRYDEELSNPLAVGKLHTFSVYVIKAKDNRCVGAVDSPKFTLMPAWKASNQRAAAGRRNEQLQQQQLRKIQQQQQQQQQQLNFQLHLQQLQQQRMFGSMPGGGGYSLPSFFPQPAMYPPHHQFGMPPSMPMMMMMPAIPLPPPASIASSAPTTTTTTSAPGSSFHALQPSREAYAAAMQQQQHQMMTSMMMLASSSNSPRASQTPQSPQHCQTTQLGSQDGKTPSMSSSSSSSSSSSPGQPHFLHRTIPFGLGFPFAANPPSSSAPSSAAPSSNQ